MCKGCGDPYTVGNAFHKLCYRCNTIRLADGKSSKKPLNSVIPEKDIIIRKMMPKVTTIRKGVVKGKHEEVNPYGVKGELELFKIIWEEREHICLHCSSPLGDELAVHFCSHIYPKSIRPWLRLDPDNIELLCYKCHHEHDFGKRKEKLL